MSDMDDAAEGEMGDAMDPALGGEGQGAGAGLGILLPGMSNRAKLASQSLMAVQELGMVIGVAFLVGILFMLMIYLEKAWSTTTDKLHDICGRKPKDEEDPAALVGTFKRYKN